MDTNQSLQVRIYTRRSRIRILLWAACSVLCLLWFYQGLQTLLLGSLGSLSGPGEPAYLRVSDWIRGIQDPAAFAAQGREMLSMAGYGANAARIFRISLLPWFLPLFLLVIIGLLVIIAGIVRQNRICRRYEEQLHTLKLRYEKEYQEQLTREKDAQRENFSRSLQNISHQIKTPLTGVLLYEQVLHDTEPSPERRGRIGDCIRQLERIQSLILQLLRLGQLDSGKTAMHLERITWGRLVEEIRDMIQSIYEEKRISLQVSLFDEGACALIDRFWMKEAIANLLKNAAESSPEGGSVFLSLTPLSGGVELFIRDQGPGVPVEEREQLFDRYAERPKGTLNVGLGLAISKEVVTRHGGTLVLMPQEEDVGACFRIRLYELPGK